MPYTPLDADDTVISATPSNATSSQAAPTLLDHDDEVIPDLSAQSAPLATQDAINDQVLKMLNDPKVSGAQLRAFWTAQGGKLSEHDSKVIDDRDAYIAKNHATPTIGVQADPTAQSGTPGLVDNRPYGFEEGMRVGVQHVLSNVAGGAGWVGNKVGLDNDWGDNSRAYFDHLESGETYQPSSAGKLTGEVIATAPAALVAAPVEAGAAAVGAPAAAAVGLGLLADGALGGALTTDARTPGGVARDAAIGGTLGLGLGSAGRGLARLAGTPTAAAQAGRHILDTADRLGVKPLPADVGGALTRSANAAGEAGLLSHGPIRNAADDYLDSLQGVRDAAASSILPAGAQPKTLQGAALDVLHGVGGLGDYEARSAEQGGKLYDQAADLAGDTEIATPRTLAAVNALIEQAERTPGNTPGVDPLRALRDDLTPSAPRTSAPSIFDREFGGANPTVTPGNRARFAIDSLRRLRTSFGDNFDAGQRAAKEAAKTLWGPLSEDIQDGLHAAGKGDAADAYNAADQFWEQRGRNLDEVVNPILGNRSHEQLANTIEGLSRNDSDLLGRGLGLMDPDEAAHTKAAIIGNLGKASPGTQNATNDAFSIAQFGTDWAKLSQGVKDHLLSGNEGQNLQDLATLAEAAKDAGRYRNTSGTARSSHALDVLGGLGTALAGGTGGLVAGVKTGGASLAAEYGLGKLMSSPAVSRAIVKAGEVRPIARTGSALARLGQRTAPTIQNQ
jgi:hypothetical protein